MGQHIADQTCIYVAYNIAIRKTLLLTTELEQMRSENQSQASELLQLREAIKRAM